MDGLLLFIITITIAIGTITGAITGFIMKKRSLKEWLATLALGASGGFLGGFVLSTLSSLLAVVFPLTAAIGAVALIWIAGLFRH